MAAPENRGPGSPESSPEKASPPAGSGSPSGGEAAPGGKESRAAEAPSSTSEQSPERQGRRMSELLPTWAVEREDAPGSSSAQEGKGAATRFSPPSVPYRLRREVARGGFGEVWEAEQTALGRVVAVKKIQDALVARREGKGESADALIYRFYQEAIVTARLEHPNIVPVYDLGVDPRGQPLLAMKLVRGAPWIELLQKDFPVLAPEEFLGRHLLILIDMAQAVAFAHSRGIVHRDLKPSQVMVGQFGEVVLMDWGLAVYVGDSRSAEDSSGFSAAEIPRPETASSPAGTPTLMAPEQALDTAMGVTPLTDIYLLGGTLYFMLTGAFPHRAQASLLAVKQSHLTEEVEPPESRAPGREIPRELSELAMRALRRDPQERVQSAGEFIQGLQDYLTGASKRRQSMEIARQIAQEAADSPHPPEAEEILEPLLSRTAARAEDSAAYYSVYASRANRLDEAAALWPRNPEVGRLREQTLRDYALAAIANGDLTLARAVVNRMTNRDRADMLTRVIERREALARLERRQGRLAFAALLILLVALAAGSMKYMVAQRQSTAQLARERDRAQQAQRLTEQAQAEALHLRDLAEAARSAAERENYYSSIALAFEALEAGETIKARQTLLAAPAAWRQWEWGYLLGRVYPEEMILATQGVYHAAFTPDSQFAVTGGTGEIALWRLDTGGRVWRWQAANRMHFWTVAISRDGRWVLGASRDNTATLLDARTGEFVRQFKGHAEYLRGADISPDGRRAATCGADDTLRLWNLETGELERTVRDFSADVYCVRFSPDSARVLTASLDGRATLWSAATGEKLREFEGHDERVLSAVFSPGGDRVATAGTDRFLRVFDTETGTMLYEVENPGAYLHYADISPDGQWIATSDDKGACRLWRLETGAMEKEFFCDDPAWKILFSPDGTSLLVTARRGVRLVSLARLFAQPQIERDPEPFSLREPVDGVARVFGPAGDLDRAWNGRERSWNVPGGATRIRAGGRSFLAVSKYAAFNPDRTLRVEIEPESRHARVLAAGGGAIVADLGVTPVRRAEFSPGGSRLACALMDGRVEIRDTASWRLLRVLEKNPPGASPEDAPTSRPADALAFHPSEPLLAVGYFNRGVSLWNMETGVETLAPSALYGGVCVDFSPDGARLAVGFTNDMAQILDIRTGDVLAELRGHRRRIQTIRFSPDGGRLVTSSADQAVKLWDAQNGRELLTLYQGPPRNRLEMAVCAEFSTDGRDLFEVTTGGEFFLFRAFPWRMEEYPGEGLDTLQRIEWWKRNQRLAAEITRADVAPDEAP